MNVYWFTRLSPSGPALPCPHYISFTAGTCNPQFHVFLCMMVQCVKAFWSHYLPCYLNYKQTVLHSVTWTLGEKKKKLQLNHYSLKHMCKSFWWSYQCKVWFASVSTLTSTSDALNSTILSLPGQCTFMDLGEWCVWRERCICYAAEFKCRQAWLTPLLSRAINHVCLLLTELKWSSCNF